MKRLLFVVMATILSMTLLSCEKEKDSTTTPIEGNKDYYYVKYQISGKVYFYIDGVSYNTEKGTRTESFAAARSFETICGPVSKNFAARIMLTKYRGAPTNDATKISVSKNNGPFAVKASGQYSASYVIDF